MSDPHDDALNDFAALRMETKVAVLAAELQNQRQTLGEVKRTVRSIQGALWGLIVALIAVAATLLAGHIH